MPRAVMCSDWFPCSWGWVALGDDRVQWMAMAVGGWSGDTSVKLKNLRWRNKGTKRPGCWVRILDPLRTVGKLWVGEKPVGARSLLRSGGEGEGAEGSSERGGGITFCLITSALGVLCALSFRRACFASILLSYFSIVSCLRLLLCGLFLISFLAISVEHEPFKILLMIALNERYFSLYIIAKYLLTLSSLRWRDMPIVTSPTEASNPPTPDPHPGLCVGKLILLTDFLTFKLSISYYVCSTRRLIYDICILVCD